MTHKRDTERILTQLNSLLSQTPPGILTAPPMRRDALVAVIAHIRTLQDALDAQAAAVKRPSE